MQLRKESLKKSGLSVTIQMKATEQYFPVVLYNAVQVVSNFFSPFK